jgi:galactose oxidase
MVPRLLAVFHAGPSVNMHWFDTTGRGSYKSAGTRPGVDGMNGNAVMYDAVKGKILTVGGGVAYDSRPAHADAAIVTLTGMTVTSKKIGAMQYKRAFAMAPVLPDGKVVVIGGQPLPVRSSEWPLALAQS